MFLKKVVLYVYHLHPQLTKVIYFSNGSAAQYTNHRNFINLIWTILDYWLSDISLPLLMANQLCDGIRDTVKQSAAHTSLQAVTKDHILTLTDLFLFGEKNIKSIYFIWVGKDKVTQNAKEPWTRFSRSASIPGTRDNHSFDRSAGFQVVLASPWMRVGIVHKK